MADQLLHKLRNFGIDPPQHTWENISGILEREYDQSEIGLAIRLSSTEIEPPLAAREFLDSTLYSTQQQDRNPARIFSIPVLKIAAAAVFLGIISVTAFYLLNRNLPTSVQNQVSVFPDASKENIQPEIIISESNQSNSSESATASTSSVVPTRLKNRSVRRAQPVQYAEAIVPEENRTLQYTTIDGETLRVSPSREITVDAPPIRDNQGNIIMDLQLVSTDNQQYFIVTSPNGEQTRISRKFAAMLSYLNEEAVPQNFSIDGLEWKFRFQAWRDKLLEQASFIPTAANYLDIFELKNLIDEN